MWSFPTFLLLGGLFFMAWPLMTSQSLYKMAGYKPYFTTTADYHVASLRLCACKCRSLKCPYFSFQDDVCHIHDPGNVTTDNSTTIYRSFDPAAPTSESIMDVAYNKTCYSSSPFLPLVASRAVDGDLQTQYHSDNVTNPWWSVDLGYLYVIRGIDVLPHPGVPAWFKKIVIYAGTALPTNGDFSAYTQVGYFAGNWNGSNRILFTPPTGTIAQYVAMKGTSGTEYLNIMDVKVMV